MSTSDNTFHKDQSRKEPFGLLYNGTRRRLGIPMVQDDWFTKETSLRQAGGIIKWKRTETN